MTIRLPSPTTTIMWHVNENLYNAFKELEIYIKQKHNEDQLWFKARLAKNEKDYKAMQILKTSLHEAAQLAKSNNAKIEDITAAVKNIYEHLEWKEVEKENHEILKMQEDLKKALTRISELKKDLWTMKRTVTSLKKKW